MTPAATTVADQAVRERITTSGLRETLFVEAGAGTGKTSQLVGRVVSLVLDAGVNLADIAAITFTEAAAAELQDRIRVAFEREAASTDDPERRQRCTRAIADADLAAISTLHGFAKRILGEHPVAAGLPPRVDVLDEVTSQLAQEDRWERFVDALYDDAANEELLVRAALVDVPLEARYPNQATMKGVAADLSQSWDLLDEVADRDHGVLPPIDFSPFDRAVRALRGVFETCTDPCDRLCVVMGDEILPLVEDVAAIADPHRKLRSLTGLDDLKTGNVGRGPAWGGDAAAARATVRAVNDARAAVVADVADDVLWRLLTLVSREVQAAAEARRLEGRLEFHDLLVLARRLLRTSATARRELHARYTHLLLDEFQDTDPIQIELAVLIASAVEGAGLDSAEPIPWQARTVADGRLFFVGDPKQSIYRFRRADIELFLEARDRFGPDESWLRLVTNFRTVAPVVSWVNGLFGALMPDEVEGRQPRYEPLVAHRGGSPDGDHRPVLMGGPHERVSAAELRELEAADVARAVDDVRRRPEAWPVLDRETGEWRPGRLTDVTILVPTRTSLPYLREALDRAGLPYRLDTGTLVYDTQEVRDALAVIRAIDDPTDSLSLVAALRSPLYACADTDLFTYKAAGGQWDLRRDPPNDLPDDHPVAAAVAHLRLLWRDRWWVGPSALLDRVLREREAFVLAFGGARPKEVWRRLRFLLDQARAFEEAGGGGLRAFVEWAELQRSEGSRVHEPLLPETDDLAVRILTVHGSKGLEFPITILSGMTTKPGRSRGGVSVLWGADGTPSVKLRKGIATENHDPRADLEEEMDVHEKLRLLYVACTRARDHLVVACHHLAGDRSYACRVHELAQRAPETWRTLGDGVQVEGQGTFDLGLDPEPTPERAPGTAGLGVEGRRTAAPTTDDDREAWRAARQALLDRQRRPRVVSATAVARRGAHEAGDDLVDTDDDGADQVSPDGPSFTRRRGRAGTAIGRAVHATLQLTDLAAPEGLDAQAARQADLEAVGEHAHVVTALARAALGSAAVSLAKQHRHHKELFVAAPVGDQAVEGYVDLLIDTPEGLVIVDYKTDTVASVADVDAKLAAYELQGAAYAVALEACTRRTVVDCRFVFCSPGGAIERSVGDLDAAKQRVRAMLGA